MKRFTSIILSIAMLLSMSLLSATFVSAATSGSCGDGVFWSFDDGALTVSGEGTMGYYSVPSVPWYGLRADIVKVTVENGVRGISANAFYGCSSLLSLELADSVSSIGDFAFCGCESLTAVTLPDGLKSIGTNAFENCSSLAELTIGREIELIEDSAFEGCDSLADVRYDGTEENWRLVNVGEGNDSLLSVRFTFVASVLHGDVNLDGKVNAADVNLAVSAVLGSYAIESEALAAADFNGDGKVSAADVSFIIRAIV